METPNHANTTQTRRLRMNSHTLDPMPFSMIVSDNGS